MRAQIEKSKDLEEEEEKLCESKSFRCPYRRPDLERVLWSCRVKRSKNRGI